MEAFSIGTANQAEPREGVGEIDASNLGETRK